MLKGWILRRSEILSKSCSGYIPLITLPPGATNIRVRERKGTRNYLGKFKKADSFISISSYGSV